MSVNQVLFIIFAAIALTSSMWVVISRRVFHSALWMAASLFGVAAVFMLLKSPLMAGLQLFIYVGGISVLTVVAIMVTRGMMRLEQRFTNDSITSLLMALALFAALTWMILQVPWPVDPQPVAEDDLVILGQVLTDPQGYLLPFEVTSVMLVVVLIASLYLGRER